MNKIIKSNTLKLPMVFNIAIATMLPFFVDAEIVETKYNVNMKTVLSRSEWKEIIQWPLSCDNGVKHITEISKDFIGVERYLWPDGRNLVSVVCETGAYNQGEMIFLESQKNPGKYNRLNFTQFGLIEDQPNQQFNKDITGFKLYKKDNALLWGNLSINPTEKMITNNNFYRSGGGCGISTTYFVSLSEPSITQLKINVNCEDGDKLISEWTSYTEDQYNTWPVFNIE